MRVLKENKVTDAVVDYVFGLTKEDLISFEEADNFVNLLTQGGVDDADEYMVFDCASGSPLGNEDCAIRAIKSYFKESKKNSKKRIKESFDNPIDEIIMPYTSWSSTPLRSDADAMAENAKEAAEELKANGFTAEEVKAHFDEEGYYDAVNGTTEGEGTWDRAFANCILANLKESKKNSKKRIKEGAVKELYTELEEELEKAYEDDPMDHYAGIDTTDARINLTIEAFAKDHNLSIETVEVMAKEIQDRWDEEQFENWEEWQADPEGYMAAHPEEFGAEPLTEGFISNAFYAIKCLGILPMLLNRLKGVSNYPYWVEDLKAGHEKPVNEGTLKSLFVEEIKNWAKESRKNYDLLRNVAEKTDRSLGSLINYLAQATIDAQRKTLLKQFKKNMPLSDEEINALDEDDIALHSIPSYKSLRESELDDLVNKPFSELVNDFLNKLVADGLLEEDVKEIFITDFKNANEPEDIDIDLLYDGVGADPHDPANQEMFTEIAKMIEDAYQFKDEWAGIDASDMIDEDDPLYGYGEEDLLESKKPTKKNIKEDRNLGRTPKSFNAVNRGTTVLERDGEPWMVLEKGTVGELSRKYPEHQIYEPSYYHAVYVGDPICDYHHENKGERIFVYGEYDDVYNNVLAYYDDVPTRSWSVYMKESKKAPNRKTLKEDAIAKDRVGIEIKSSKGWVWASKDGLKPGAPLEYKNEKAAKSSKEWEKFLDKYGKENLRVSKANN